MQDVALGQERTRIWPTKRGRPKAEITREQNAAFREAQIAAKYWDPRCIILCDKLRKGTPVLIRDLQVMMMYNRFARVHLPDGRIMVSMPARQDVSESLDCICPLPGAMLIRTTEGWRFIAPPTGTGKVLTSNGDDANPADWLDPASSGGGMTNAIAATAITQGSGVNDNYIPKEGASAIATTPGDANNLKVSFNLAAAQDVVISFGAIFSRASGFSRFRIMNTAGNPVWPTIPLTVPGTANSNSHSFVYSKSQNEGDGQTVEFDASLHLPAGSYDLVVKQQHAATLSAITWYDRWLRVQL